MTDLSRANTGINSNLRDWLFSMFYDVKRQSINEQECAALERCVNSIFYFHKNSINAIPKYEHIIAPHVSSTSTFIKIADSVVMI